MNASVVDSQHLFTYAEFQPSIWDNLNLVSSNTFSARIAHTWPRNGYALSPGWGSQGLSSVLKGNLCKVTSLSVSGSGGNAAKHFQTCTPNSVMPFCSIHMKCLCRWTGARGTKTDSDFYFIQSAAHKGVLLEFCLRKSQSCVYLLYYACSPNVTTILAHSLLGRSMTWTRYPLFSTSQQHLLHLDS